MKLGRVVTGLLAAALLAGWAGQRANAAINLVETNAVHGADWTYTYSVTLTSLSQINSGTITTPGATVPFAGGDFFKLVDFSGYVSADASLLTTVGTATWQVVVNNLGLTPTDGTTVGFDATSLPNVSFQYVGTDAGNSGPQSITTVGLLGSISLHSTIGPALNNVTYQAQGESTTSFTDQTNQGFVSGPVPEAASLGVLAVGALSLLVRRRRR